MIKAFLLSSSCLKCRGLYSMATSTWIFKYLSLEEKIINLVNCHINSNLSNIISITMRVFYFILFWYQSNSGKVFLGICCGIMISSECPKKAADFHVSLLPYVANNFHHNISVEIEQNVLIRTKLTQVTHHSIWQVTVPRQLKVLCSRQKVTNKNLSLSSSVSVIQRKFDINVFSQDPSVVFHYFITLAYFALEENIGAWL